MMIDPLTKAKALQSRAMSAKADAFSKLRECDKQQAMFLRAVADTFGKPDAIAIRFADGRRYDGGAFSNAQDYADFQRRSDVLHQKFVRGES